MKTLTLRLTDEIHKELKILSNSTGTTFAEAFEKTLSAAEVKETRRYTKKQLEEFAEADRI